MLKRGDTGALKIAASPMQIETALASFLPGFAERYPNVQVKLIESVGADTLGMLERGEIHLGIGLLDAIQANDHHFAVYPVKPLELLAACHPTFPLEVGDTLDISRVTSHPLLLSDMSFSARKKFDAICRLAGLKPNILIESRAHHTKLALAEAGLGVAIISTTVQTHRYRLRTIRITYKRKPIQEPLAVVWDKRRVLPRYAQDFCELLAAHMRKLFPTTQLSAPKASPQKRSRGRTRLKSPAHIKRGRPARSATGQTRQNSE
jgi:DNA-binding transcriptional LysR family regulator